MGAGIPAVEFGPEGAGHHGPDEWVSVTSLARYRRALRDFIRALPMRLGEAGARERDLKAIDGGLT
jgi:succinyl-diaminopimelate desuccinylase